MTLSTSKLKESTYQISKNQLQFTDEFKRIDGTTDGFHDLTIRLDTIIANIPLRKKASIAKQVSFLFVKLSFCWMAPSVGQIIQPGFMV